jgi:YVTN family beta-propeller protein
LTLSILNPQFYTRKPRRREFPTIAAALSVLLALISCSCSRRPDPPLPYLAFVVSQETNSVAVVNLAGLRVVASLTVSRAPEAAVLRPRSQEIFITGAGGIDRIHIPDLKVRLNSRTDNHPRCLVFSPDGRFAYYLLDPESPPAALADSTAEPPSSGFSNIGMLDCESGKELEQIRVRGHLSHLAITSDGKTLLASDPAASAVHVFDAAARKPLGALPAGKGAGPLAIQVLGSKAFVSNTEEDKITVVDTTTRQVLAHIELGMRPASLLLKPDGGELFVLCPQAATLAIVDAFHDNVSQTLPTGRNPQAGVFRRDSSLLYIANSGDGSVMIMDVQNRVVLSSTPVGRAPRALALTPDERFLAVADEGAATLAVLIAEPTRLAKVRSALVTSIPVGARPVDVIIPDWLGL